MITTKGFSSLNGNYNLINNAGRYTEFLACFTNFTADTANLRFRSEYDIDYPGRPYLVMNGTIDSVLASTETLGLMNIVFPEGDKYESNLIYEFNDKELSDLAGKGLFNKEFEIPKVLDGMTFRVPKEVKLDMVIVDDGKSVPLVFADVSNPYESIINETVLGQSLTPMFKEIEREVEDDYDLDLGEELTDDLEQETEVDKDLDDVMSKVPEADENDFYYEEKEVEEEPEETHELTNEELLKQYQAVSEEAKKLFDLNKEEFNKTLKLLDAGDIRTVLGRNKKDKSSEKSNKNNRKELSLNKNFNKKKKHNKKKNKNRNNYKENEQVKDVEVEALAKLEGAIDIKDIAELDNNNKDNNVNYDYNTEYRPEVEPEAKLTEEEYNKMQEDKEREINDSKGKNYEPIFIKSKEEQEYEEGLDI